MRGRGRRWPCRAPREVPTSQGLSHPRRCRITHCRREVDEVLTPPILRPTRAKRVSQEGELLRGILPRPVVILAVDDVRLLRMDVQRHCARRRHVRQDLLRLRLRPTVRDDIVRVPLERNVRVRRPHPVVEREVQEDIGQERARDAPLGRPHRARHQSSVFLLHGSGQPPLHIEQNPPHRVYFLTARMTSAWSRLSKKPRISKSITQS